MFMVPRRGPAWLLLVAALAAMLLAAPRPRAAAASPGGWPEPGGPGHNYQVPWLLPTTAPSSSVRTFEHQVVAGPVAAPDGTAYLVLGEDLIQFSPAGNPVWGSRLGRVDHGALALERDRGSAYQVYVAIGSTQMIRAYSSVGLQWERWLASPATSGLSIQPSTGRVLFGTDNGRVAGWGRDGTQAFQLDPGGTVNHRPAMGPGGMFYVASRHGTLTGYGQQGGWLWQRPLGAQVESPPLLTGTGRATLRTADGRAHCVGSAGELIYSASIGPAVGGAAVGAQGEVYYCGQDGKLRRVGPDGQVTVFADTGTVPVRAVLLAFGCGSLLACVNQQAIAFGPGGAQLWQVALPAPVFDLAAPADGTVLIAAGNHLVRLSSAPQGTTPPCLPTLELSPPDGQSGWYRSSPRAAAGGRPSAGWPSDLELWVEVDAPGGPFIQALEPDGPAVEIEAQGTARVRLGYRRGAGPAEHTAWQPVMVDRVAPQATLVRPRDGEEVPLGQELRPEVLAADSGSGVAQVAIWVDGIAVSGPLVPAAGTRSVRVEVRDHAGNLAVLTSSFTVRDGSPALCLSPVLSGPASTAPAWSRWVTVRIRLGLASLAAGEPGQVRLAGVPGTLVARLPAARGSSTRSFLFRFPRQEVVAALALMIQPGAAGRLHRLQPALTWRCGEQVWATTVDITYRP